jgi:hypothetical protein
MRRHARFGTTLLAAGLIAASPSLAAGPELASTQRDRGSFLSWLAAPFAWLASSESPICTDGLCREIERRNGWLRLGYDVRDVGHGVYLEVQGKVQFRSAEIVFTDGHLTRLDLAYSKRGNGIYELREFDDEREVMLVRLLARAVTDDATLAVRLGRDGVR